MELPSLQHDFLHSVIVESSIGPRRELSLHIALSKVNSQITPQSDEVGLRFGGIENFDEVSAFFRETPREDLELASLDYAEHPHSKPGALHLVLQLERVDVRLQIDCSSVRLWSIK